jgi:AcrR family transcriptional regulator
MAWNGPDRRTERTRHAAVGAFIDLLFEQGYEAVTMAAVAERAGLGRSTVYEHFRTKDALLEASLAGPIGVLAADPPDAAALGALAEHVRERAGQVRLVLAQPLRSRIAGVLAGRIEARLRAAGMAAGPAQLRALTTAEGQLAALALWVRPGSGLTAPALVDELARLGCR